MSLRSPLFGIVLTLPIGFIGSCAARKRTAPGPESQPKVEVEAGRGAKPIPMAVSATAAAGEVRALLQQGKSPRAERIACRFVDALTMDPTLLSPTPGSALANAVDAAQEASARAAELEDAARSAGSDVAANWYAAASAAGRARTDPRICDPSTWEKLVIGHLPAEAWPPEAEEAIVAGVRSSIEVATVDVATSSWAPWAFIASQRCERSEYTEALLAWSRAEQSALNGEQREWARLGQAKVLARLKEFSQARAIATVLAASRSEFLSKRALGVLGSLELASNHPGRARVILERALEGWEGHSQDRLQALANYGITLLMLGEEAAGLACVRDARVEMERAGFIEDAERASRNEISFLETQSDREAERNEAIAQLHRLEEQ